MNPLAIILPLIIMVSGIAVFFLVPLPLPVRVFLLLTDVAAAALVWFILMRKSRG